MEAANYFAGDDEPRYETPSFRRSNAFAATGREVAAVRNAVGINEIHNFGKYLVTGPGARDWLDWIMAGKVPAVGRLSLTPMLSPKGKIIGDFTISALAEERFQLTASFGAQNYHMRWFLQHLPQSGVTIENISTQRIGFQIAGPYARDLLASVVKGDVSAKAFKFMDVREFDIGLLRATVQRVSYTGDLGYEIYVNADEQRTLYDILATAGDEYGLQPFGMRAMMSLRLEKFFGSWMREFGPDYMPAETGLDRFVSYGKSADFIGKAAVTAERDAGPSRRICAFEVDADDADVVAYEPIFIDDDVVGFCTSGGYAHNQNKSIALGFVPTDMIRDDLQVEIEILGDKRRATILTEMLFDADGARMRG